MYKYAITFLCMLKEHYVIAACICAYIHKCFINKLDRKIDLIIMCDINIYKKYGTLLKKFYDKVDVIKLSYFKLNNDYKFVKEKYASWVKYATNKWQNLKYDKYDKILFLDIDMLPAKKEFYNIFDLETPAIYRTRFYPQVKYEKSELIDLNVLDKLSFDEYLELASNFDNSVGSLDGGMVLLKPSKKLYKEYEQLTFDLFSEKGIYSYMGSFPDETSLFYFLSVYKKIPIYTIPNKYSIIPWLEPDTNYTNDDINNALLYNYNSFYKPWLKGYSMQWKEEKIWSYIYKNMNPDNILIKLYKNSVKEHYLNTFMKLDSLKQKKRYELKVIENVNEDNICDIPDILDNNFGKINIDELNECFLTKSRRKLKRSNLEHFTDFPYRNNIYTDEDKIKTFKNLLTNKLDYRHELTIPQRNINLIEPFFLYNGGYYYLTYKNSDYFTTYILSDMFNDDCRSKCAFGKNITPLEYFEKNEPRLRTIVSQKVKTDNIRTFKTEMREAIYNETVECSIHNPSIIKYFIEKYKAKKILDFSSGWGDRLLGAMASNIDLYVGVDPNPCLHPNYKNMISLLTPYIPNVLATYELIQDKFETATINYTDFDLIYTSPPYYDYEKYSSVEGQSHLSYKLEDEWYTNFLQVSVKKALGLLKYDGHMVLYISQEKGKTYMEKFLQWVISLPNIYYLGCINYADNKLRSPHPIFIYKKSKKVPQILYNPKLDIKKINDYNVILDDKIVGGTKVRAGLSVIRTFLKNDKIKQLIYLGAANGYAPAAISYCLYLLKRNDIKLVIVAQKIDIPEINKLHELTKFYHPNTEFVLKEGTMKDLYPVADSYNSESDKIIPFGFHFDEYKKKLYKKLYKHLIKYVDIIKRMWIIVGSGTILYVLQKILTKTHFLGVQVGRDLKDDEIYDKTRLELFKSSLKMYSSYENDVPYNTVSSYDAKVWEYSDKKGQKDDYIWNVAGIHQYIR